MRHWNDPAAPLQYLWDSTIFGGTMFQTWADLFIWEKFLNIAGAKSLIELGSGEGFFSLWLGCQCYQRDMEFLTVDEDVPAALQTPLAMAMTTWWQFRQFDIFEDTSRIEYHIARYPKPLILLCDNGDKKREFETFVPMLDPGDYVVVHDLGQEFHPADVEPFASMLRPIDGLASTLSRVQTFSLWMQRSARQI